MRCSGPVPRDPERPVRPSGTTIAKTGEMRGAPPRHGGGSALRRRFATIVAVVLAAALTGMGPARADTTWNETDALRTPI